LNRDEAYCFHVKLLKKELTFSRSDNWTYRRNHRHACAKSGWWNALHIL